MQNRSLVLLGSGIKFLSHLTNEAKAYIEQSEVVLYLVNDPAMKEWIQKKNHAAESLDFLYSKYKSRLDCYHAITEYILNSFSQYQNVCVVFYGHPTMFAKPGLDAVKKAKQEGIFVKVLPGISAEACLFADLLIDPGLCGYQSFEATDFLIRKRKFDPSCHLILWQVDIIGVYDNPSIPNRKGLAILNDYLNDHYDPEHKIVLYEAAQYPGFMPRIETYLLEQLSTINFSRISSLYIPPKAEKNCDKAILQALRII